ncbi:hypothetical protein [Ammoniphilus sp. 3BR4]|uniref:hypothetical protein n=1 Tax=Ammoniphilus sp. 3BR4 TaxID=3158265 RepID=UPI003465C28B
MKRKIIDFINLSTFEYIVCFTHKDTNSDWEREGIHRLDKPCCPSCGRPAEVFLDEGSLTSEFFEVEEDVFHCEFCFYGYDLFEKHFGTVCLENRNNEHGGTF